MYHILVPPRVSILNVLADQRHKVLCRQGPNPQFARIAHHTSTDATGHAQAHAAGAKILVDSTFAPPPLQYPFKWGADMVMHSGAYGTPHYMPACSKTIYRHQVLWRALGSAVRCARCANRGRVADGKYRCASISSDRSEGTLVIFGARTRMADAPPLPAASPRPDPSRLARANGCWLL